MPCYRFRFNHELPLYYYGHGGSNPLPPPIVKIILQYGYEMTVWEDMCKLHDKLDDMPKFLRLYKEDHNEHLKAYAILRSENTISDRISTDSTRLCHDATVNLVTAMCPQPKRRRSIFTVHRTQREPAQQVGFVLPEMSNYV